MQIVITAGHGGSDPGAVYGGFNERDLMTELRDLVALKLRQKNIEVSTDGTKGQNLPLADALKLIYGKALAVELHTNAAESSSATGVECIALPSHKAVAQRISKGIADVLGLRLRGDNGWIDQSKSARGKLGFVSKGGIIVETFFLSNPSDLAAYQDKKWLVAQAIADSVT
jgi:N-acetylmuramoyl-L-alanine amidase